jgi:hypothetical protein
MPPDPSEEQFLAASGALVASYGAAIPALQAQVAQIDADPIVLTYGDWARATSDLIATLRGLNAQARALPVPPRYAASWAEMLAAVDLLDIALDNLDEGVSLYDLRKIALFKENLAAAQGALAAVPQISPLPVIVVSVPTPVVIPVTTPSVIAVSAPVAISPAEASAANVCNVCPSPTVPPSGSLPVEKGGVVSGSPTPTVIVPPVSTAILITPTVAVPPLVPTIIVPTIIVPTIIVPTVAVPTAPIPTVPIPTAVAPSLASGGLGLTLEEWTATHGQADALAEGLYVFDEPEQTYSLLVVNGRISTIYVAWKPEFRPNLAVAQGAALQLIPRDASLVQASSLSAERFVGQYQSQQLATVFPDAPYAPQPVGTFSIIYQLAADGPVFQMVVTIGNAEP